MKTAQSERLMMSIMTESLCVCMICDIFLKESEAFFLSFKQIWKSCFAEFNIHASRKNDMYSFKKYLGTSWVSIVLSVVEQRKSRQDKYILHGIKDTLDWRSIQVSQFQEIMELMTVLMLLCDKHFSVFLFQVSKAVERFEEFWNTKSNAKGCMSWCVQGAWKHSSIYQKKAKPIKDSKCKPKHDVDNYYNKHVMQQLGNVCKRIYNYVYL